MVLYIKQRGRPLSLSIRVQGEEDKVLLTPKGTRARTVYCCKYPAIARTGARASLPIPQGGGGGGHELL